MLNHYDYYNEKMIAAFTELLSMKKLSIKKASDKFEKISYQTCQKIGKADNDLSLKIILNIYKQSTDLIREDKPDFELVENLETLLDVDRLNNQLISDVEIMRKRIEVEYKQEITNTDMFNLLKPSTISNWFKFLNGKYQFQIDKILEIYSEIERLTNGNIKFDYKQGKFLNEFN